MNYEQHAYDEWMQRFAEGTTHRWSTTAPTRQSFSSTVVKHDLNPASKNAYDKPMYISNDVDRKRFLELDCELGRVTLWQYAHSLSVVWFRKTDDGEEHWFVEAT